MQINILIRVQDNFGDMGFAYECLFHLFRASEGVFFFRIYTDEVDTLSDFLDLQQPGFVYQIHSDVMYLSDDHSKVGAFIVFFRTHFTREWIDRLPHSVVTLWIDYLTFDPDIARLSGGEHWLSTADRPIYHIGNSPHCNGLLPRFPFAHSPQISTDTALVFSYEPWSILTKIAQLPYHFSLYTHTGHFLGEQMHISLEPYVAIDTFYGSLSVSRFSIIRGEVSFVQALHSGVPFYWDMYKALGGWNKHEHECFLIWIKQSFDRCQAQSSFERYAQASYRLNTSYDITPDDILLLDTSEMREVFGDIQARVSHTALIETIQAYIC